MIVNVVCVLCRILSCLMEHLYTDKMVEPCEQRLLELQYFISRDWKWVKTLRLYVLGHVMFIIFTWRISSRIFKFHNIFLTSTFTNHHVTMKSSTVNRTYFPGILLVGWTPSCTKSVRTTPLAFVILTAGMRPASSCHLGQFSPVCTATLTAQRCRADGYERSHWRNITLYCNLCPVNQEKLLLFSHLLCYGIIKSWF